ncbi:MAG: DNA polymerase III subunit [Acidobacteriia bacterium]|nr:DNA polymerase III subunit [Terriglobia bacterium]
MFENFHGNHAAASTLAEMIERHRIPQTILLDGKEGVGKATLARRFAARLLGGGARIEHDDLSLPHNVSLLAEREKLPSEKRAEDPFLLATHPDFVTFAPDGPLRQISIQQTRLLKERAQFAPLAGSHRVFLIDGIDRANEQAANSLLKMLEEPPPYLILLLTAENPYDLLPTIRSRSVPVRLAPLSPAEMLAFARGQTREMDHVERRIALASGSPGIALSVDLELYDRRRAAMCIFLEAASGAAPFHKWAQQSEKLALARSEKLEPYLKVLLLLLEDLLHVREGIEEVRNPDLQPWLASLAPRLSFEWLRAAVTRTDDLVQLLRRNIQKNIALDALVIELVSSTEQLSHVLGEVREDDARPRTFYAGE